MRNLSTESLEDVEVFVATEWPKDPIEIRARVQGHFKGRPEILSNNSRVSIVDDRISNLGWFVFYESNKELLKKHEVFLLALATRFGAPFDSTPTSAAWRIGEVLVETYAHLAPCLEVKPSHQIALDYSGSNDA